MTRSLCPAGADVMTGSTFSTSNPTGLPPSAGAIVRGFAIVWVVTWRLQVMSGAAVEELVCPPTRTAT